jgi:sporulation protein YlmC with PRC-barrel domain
MKKSSEIIKLPVLSIQDGTSVEKIARLAVNPANKAVEYLAFAGTPWYEPPWVLPWSKLKAVGRDLITIKSRKDMAQVNDGLRQQLAKTVDVIGAEVIDASGRLCGTVADFEIDEVTGELRKLDLEDGGILDAGAIVTLGAQVIVVEGGIEIKETKPEVKPEPKPKAEAKAEAKPETKSPAFSESDFLLGKTAAVDITDDKGHVVIAAGTVVTAGEIEAAKAAGALYDLVTGVK